MGYTNQFTSGIIIALMLFAGAYISTGYAAGVPVSKPEPPARLGTPTSKPASGWGNSHQIDRDTQYILDKQRIIRIERAKRGGYVRELELCNCVDVDLSGMIGEEASYSDRARGDYGSREASRARQERQRDSNRHGGDH